MFLEEATYQIAPIQCNANFFAGLKPDTLLKIKRKYLWYSDNVFNASTRF